MVQKTTKELLGILEYQIDQTFEEIKTMKEENHIAHQEVKEDLRFLKNNIFDPKEGIWTEIKDNSNFRKDTITWRNALGVGVFSLIGKHIWDFIKSINS